MSNLKYSIYCFSPWLSCIKTETTWVQMSFTCSKKIPSPPAPWLRATLLPYPCCRSDWLSCTLPNFGVVSSGAARVTEAVRASVQLF